MRNRRRTKERSFGCVPSKIMTARFLRSWWEEGRGGEEVVTNPGSYHVLSTRAAPSEGTTPREREREGGPLSQPSQIRRRILTRPAPRCPFCSRARGTESTARYRCLRSGGRHCPTTETTYASHASTEQQRDETRREERRMCTSVPLTNRSTRESILMYLTNYLWIHLFVYLAKNMLRITYWLDCVYIFFWNCELRFYFYNFSSEVIRGLVFVQISIKVLFLNNEWIVGDSCSIKDFIRGFRDGSIYLF